MPSNNPMLTDGQWEKLAPLLPQLRTGKPGGRHWAESWRVSEGILWIARNGARWQDLAGAYPSPPLLAAAARLGGTGGLADNLANFSWGVESAGLRCGAKPSSMAASLPRKRGAGVGKTKRATVQTGWWWSMARALLWEKTWSRAFAGELTLAPQTPRSRPAAAEAADPDCGQGSRQRPTSDQQRNVASN